MIGLEGKHRVMPGSEEPGGPLHDKPRELKAGKGRRGHAGRNAAGTGSVPASCPGPRQGGRGDPCGWPNAGPGGTQVTGPTPWSGRPVSFWLRQKAKEGSFQKGDTGCWVGIDWKEPTVGGGWSVTWPLQRCRGGRTGWTWEAGDRMHLDKKVKWTGTAAGQAVEGLR